MSSAQTKGSEAKNIRPPTHAHQQKTAQEDPIYKQCTKNNSKTVFPAPDPLPAEQAESVSRNRATRGFFNSLEVG